MASLAVDHPGMAAAVETTHREGSSPYARWCCIHSARVGAAL